SELLKLHHHDGDALLSAEMCVLRWHGNTLHQVLHLVLETAHPLPPLIYKKFQLWETTTIFTYNTETDALSTTY
ncbi:hypothetical protein, partial [Pseudomonas lundensis]|uniref:hypothetical protein n=1 Tax=Pseudomonas lundensis TaxID=86185 RepID=UPI001CB71BA9